MLHTFTFEVIHKSKDTQVECYSHDRTIALRIAKNHVDRFSKEGPVQLVETTRTLIDPETGLPVNQPDSNFFVQYPFDVTPALQEIITLKFSDIFPLCEAWRAAGYNIDATVDAERAFIIHWLIGLYLVHGKRWREQANKQAKAIVKVNRKAS